MVAAVLVDTGGRVLIAQRPRGKHLAGAWEFPGGKLEPGEERRAGLQRELREELGIEIGTPRPLLRLRHAYPEREVLLDVWVVRQWRGAPRGLDGQALRWCSRSELERADLLPADAPIVRALRLPAHLGECSTPEYVIDDASPLASEAQRAGGRLRGVWCADSAEALAARAGGADFVVLAEELPGGEIAALCERVPLPVYARGLVRESGLALERWLALEAAWELGATGTHALTRQLYPASTA